MRVAALYDVHGNLPALEAVLADLERDGGVDEGVAGAFWSLLGPDIELRRTAYDTEHALARLRETGFPRFDEIFAGSLEGRAAAGEATTEFESLRGA